MFVRQSPRRTASASPFPADILPTCLCETVEMVALYEAVWRPNGHHRHGLGRLVMKGSGVRFPASAPKLRRKSRVSTKRSVGPPRATDEETAEGDIGRPSLLRLEPLGHGTRRG